MLVEEYCITQRPRLSETVEQSDVRWWAKLYQSSGEVSEVREDVQSGGVGGGIARNREAVATL
jgi:hypothetical protein